MAVATSPPLEIEASVCTEQGCVTISRPTLIEQHENVSYSQGLLYPWTEVPWSSTWNMVSVGLNREPPALLTISPILTIHRQREHPTLLTVIRGLVCYILTSSVDCRSWAKEGHLCPHVAVTALQGTVWCNELPIQLVIAKWQRTLMPPVPLPCWPMKKWPLAATVMNLSKVPTISAKK